MVNRRKRRGPSMTVGKIAAIAFIYLAISAAWMVLGTSVYARTDDRSASTGHDVESLWGAPQLQTPPKAWCVWEEKTTVPVRVGNRTVRTTKTVSHREPLSLNASDVDVDLRSEPRRKGLLWHRTYKVGFQGRYTFRHSHDKPHALEVEFGFPAAQAIYDDFHFTVNGRESDQPVSTEQGIRERAAAVGAGNATVAVNYRSQGIDTWLYNFGDNVSRVKEFNLQMTTDFREIDFPDQTLSPTAKQASRQGWNLTWSYGSLISGVQLGMEMPQKLNPGPLAARMSFFAPISLLFFFCMIFMITVLRDVRLHPIHYLFLGCSFFAFHLLFAYLADRMLPLPTFLICSLVSVGLVVSYLRLVTGTRFALVEAGLSQLVYLVLFSYAFFFEGLTGLAITILSILSLFVVMQLTGKVNWEEKFAAPKPPAPRPGGQVPAVDLSGIR
jgi:inner membrane protein involved in colicin E2 resistance